MGETGVKTRRAGDKYTGFACGAPFGSQMGGGGVAPPTSSGSRERPLTRTAHVVSRRGASRNGMTVVARTGEVKVLEGDGATQGLANDPGPGKPKVREKRDDVVR